MLQIDTDLLERYRTILGKNSIVSGEQSHYVKWLRYYLDFCHKYDFEKKDAESLKPFLEKLKSKKQNLNQRQQASDAVHIFYSLDSVTHLEEAQYIRHRHSDRVKEKNAHYSDPDNAKKNDSYQGGFKEFEKKWQKAVAALEDEIKMRHYSPKTLKSYRSWVFKFRGFTGYKDTEELDIDDVKRFLTYQAVEANVSASSQNLAFNALLFFYRHVLGKEFGKVDGIVRAKKRPYIPVVLSREEVDRVLENLYPPYDLVVKLLYGCGLRLFECLNLRINSFNFDAGILTVHDGKGKKDRTVPIPKILEARLKDQLEKVDNLHQADLADSYDGAFMFDSIEKKYKGAGKAFLWQWFFPAKSLTYVKASNETRRYHLHETHVQRALKRAAGKAKLTKRVTAYTFRHSYASHLLEANYDIRTIQELLGHSDIRTTMIYTHTVKSKTIKEAGSPLDL